MRLDSFYPVLLADDVQASSAFYIENFGFRLTFESDWYVSLIHGENPAYQLAFLLRTHPTVPDELRNQTSNLLLNFEVSDAHAEALRLEKRGFQFVLPLRDEPWGQRHFITRDPQGNMIDIIEVIPATGEFAEQYVV